MQININTIIGIAGTVALSILTFSLRFVWLKIQTHWRKQEQVLELNHMKLDAVVYTLSTFNNGMSAKFKEVYTLKLEQLKEEKEFINK